MRAGNALVLFIFFASNYFAHCATVRTYPGSSTLDIVLRTALDLFLPSPGIGRALFSIQRHSRFIRNRNELERAAAAGALRLLVRNQEWRPEEGDRIKPLLNGRNRLKRGNKRPKNNSSVLAALSALGIIRLRYRDESHSGTSSPIWCKTGDSAATELLVVGKGVGDHSGPLPKDGVLVVDTSETGTPTGGVSVASDDLLSYADVLSAPGSFSAHILRDSHQLHGKALLSPCYSWFAVHHDAKILWAGPSRERDDVTGKPPSISSNYTWIQSLIAFFQVGSAALTLHNSRGNQIQHYGYAAFGLTVALYLVMSLWNLVAQIATPEYPTV